MGAPSKWNDFDTFHLISGNNALVTAVCSPFAGMASDLPTFNVSPMAANSWRSSATSHATARSVPAMVPSSRKKTAKSSCSGDSSEAFAITVFYGELLRKCEEQWS